MAKLVLNGATSGSVTLDVPATAGSNTLTLPATTATVITDSSGVLNIGSGQVYKDASGNVGIGTTSPGYRLDVTSSASSVANLNSTGANGNTLIFRNSGTINGYVGSAKNIVSGTITDFGVNVSGANNREGTCLICNETKLLVVDHCHKTGEVRGLICSHCNSVLGYAKDNISTLENAVKYLKGE